VGWFPLLKGTHGRRAGDLITATEKSLQIDNYVMIFQIKGGGEWRAKSLPPTSCFLLPHFVLASSLFIFFPSLSHFAAKLIFFVPSLFRLQN